MTKLKFNVELEIVSPKIYQSIKQKERRFTLSPDILIVLKIIINYKYQDYRSSYQYNFLTRTIKLACTKKKEKKID